MESQSCIESCIIWEMQLPPGEKLVLLAFRDLGNSPGVPALAAATGYTERHVRRLLAALVSRGALIEASASAGAKKTYVTPDIRTVLSSEKRQRSAELKDKDKGTAVLTQNSELRTQNSLLNVTPDIPAKARAHTPARSSVVVVRSLEPGEHRDSKDKREKTTTTARARTPDTDDAGHERMVQLALDMLGLAEHDTRRLVRLHGVERVRAVIGYAATYADDFYNPAGFAIAKLAQGWMPPRDALGFHWSDLERRRSPERDWEL